MKLDWEQFWTTCRSGSDSLEAQSLIERQVETTIEVEKGRAINDFALCSMRVKKDMKDPDRTLKAKMTVAIMARRLPASGNYLTEVEKIIAEIDHRWDEKMEREINKKEEV